MDYEIIETGLDTDINGAGWFGFFVIRIVLVKLLDLGVTITLVLVVAFSFFNF